MAVTLRSTLARSVFTVWVSSKGKKELFNHLTVCKQMTHVE